MTVRHRIRSLKPETWQDEKVGHCSRDARLLFIVLITMADDEGRLRALPSVIIGHGYPYDEPSAANIRKWMRELTEAGVVRLYGKRDEYAVLPGWHRHQRINRPSPSVLPEPPHGHLTDNDVPVSSHGHVTEDSMSAHGAFTESSSPEVEVEVEGNPPTPQGAGATILKFRGRPVTGPRHDTALAVLAAFNARAGTTYEPTTAVGTTTDPMSRILGFLTDHPDVDLETCKRMIAAAWRKPYWQGVAQPGNVFGPKACERFLQEARKAQQRPAQQQTLSEQAAARTREMDARHAAIVEAAQREEGAA